MSKELIWSEESEYVYGRVVEFEDKEDFAKTVKSQYENGNCNVLNIKVESCLYTEKTIIGDQLIPLSCLDVCIENYYTAEVEEVHPQ